MSIQEQLDAVRKTNLDKQILDIFEKLNLQCRELTGGLTLEDLIEEVHHIEYNETHPEQPEEEPQETEWTTCPACNEWAVPDGCDCMACGCSPHPVF